MERDVFHRSERLFLRPPWPEDAAELTRAIAHEPVARMLARLPWPYTQADAEFWIGMHRDPLLPGFLLTVPEEGARIVGGVGLQPGPSDAPEVGYWVAPDCWGRGYATEALKGLLEVAERLGHQHLFGRHAADNPASGRVMMKAGFRPTGKIGRFRSLGRGESVPAPEYALDLGEDLSGPAGGDEEFRVAA